MTFHRVANMEDLWEGDMSAFKAGPREVLLAMRHGKVYAYDNRCPHQGTPLSSGELRGDVLTCPAHHWQYDICSGQGINPLSACLKSLPVAVDDGEISVDTD